MQIETLDRLCALAAKCRELADVAGDPEAAKALRDIAADIEFAAPIIESEVEKVPKPKAASAAQRGRSGPTPRGPTPQAII